MERCKHLGDQECWWDLCNIRFLSPVAQLTRISTYCRGCTQRIFWRLLPLSSSAGLIPFTLCSCSFKTGDVFEFFDVPMSVSKLYFEITDGMFSCRFHVLHIYSVQFSFVYTRFLYSLSQMLRVFSDVYLRLLAPWATRLLSQWMLHWWRVNDSTARVFAVHLQRL